MHSWGSVDFRICLAPKNHGSSISAKIYDFYPHLAHHDNLDFILYRIVWFITSRVNCYSSIAVVEWNFSGAMIFILLTGEVWLYKVEYSFGNMNASNINILTVCGNLVPSDTLLLSYYSHVLLTAVILLTWV